LLFKILNFILLFVITFLKSVCLHIATNYFLSPYSISLLFGSLRIFRLLPCFCIMYSIILNVVDLVSWNINVRYPRAMTFKTF
jgi:hypothetical protein